MNISTALAESNGRIYPSFIEKQKELTRRKGQQN